MFNIFFVVVASQIVLNLEEIQPSGTASNTVVRPDFDTKYLVRQLTYVKRSEDQTPITEDFCVRPFGNTCFAHLKVDTTYWAKYFLFGPQDSCQIDFSIVLQNARDNFLKYIKGSEKIFGIGDFGFINVEPELVGNGSCYVFQMNDNRQYVPTGQKWDKIWTVDDFTDRSKTKDDLVQLCQLNLSTKVDEGNLKDVCQLLAYSVLPSLVEIDVSNSQYASSLLSSLVQNTTLRNLRSIHASGLQIKDDLMDKISDMYFCLPLIRDMPQEDPRQGLSVAAIRINARVNPPKIQEINDKLLKKPLEISYLSNQAGGQAFLRLTT